MFEPGQLTREADALTHARLEAARAELDADAELGSADWFTR